MTNDAVSTDSASDGLILLIDKPGNCSSARVVNLIKKKLNAAKAGHSGTLDPLASGLMIICTGRKTKMLNGMLEYDKEYKGTMVLGESTSSYDAETEIISRRSIDRLSELAIYEKAKEFMGEIQQIPPMYSAVKHQGRPLYKYARKNVEIERKPRKVFIKDFQIECISLPDVKFRVVCSKGTYIRTLVNDFGESLSTGAYMKELRRVRIGDYELKNSITLEDFLKQDNSKTSEVLKTSEV